MRSLICIFVVHISRCVYRAFKDCKQTGYHDLPERTETDRDGPERTETDRSGPKRTFVDTETDLSGYQNGPKRTGTDRNGPERTFVDTETDFLGTELDFSGY